MRAKLQSIKQGVAAIAPGTSPIRGPGGKWLRQVRARATVNVTTSRGRPTVGRLAAFRFFVTELWQRGGGRSLMVDGIQKDGTTLAADYAVGQKSWLPKPDTLHHGLKIIRLRRLRHPRWEPYA